MSDAPAQTDLQRFMDDCVRTYEQLEALLWFAGRNEPATVDALAQTLGVPEPMLQEAVDGLIASKILVRATGSRDLIRYEPASAALRANVELLAALYEQNRLEVIRIVAENSMVRLRKSALQTFADCFLLRKGGKGG